MQIARLRGFTLIELSLVLVIIGLLVGGILVGRDLISAATIRAQISQIEQYQTAINGFRLKFNAFPGDLTTAQAGMFGLQPLTRDKTGAAVGQTVKHGDGKLDSYFCDVSQRFCQSSMDYEHVLFWQDLSSAGLIGESFTAVTDSDPSFCASLTNDQLRTYLPTARLSKSMFFFAYGFPYSIVDPGRIVQPGNYFSIGKALVVYCTGVTTISTTSITPLEGFAIDSKIDDGNPSGGTIQTGWLDYEQPTSGHPNACDEGVGSTMHYNIATAGDIPSCFLSIRFGG